MTSNRSDDAWAEFLRDSIRNPSPWELFKAGWDAKGTEAGKELRELHTIRVVHAVIAAMGGGAVLGSWIVPGRSALLGGILVSILMGVVAGLGAARARDGRAKNR
jgi:hypothetical protein